MGHIDVTIPDEPNEPGSARDVYLVFDRTIRDDTSLFDFAGIIPEVFLLYSVRDRDDLVTFIPNSGT